ncbi:glucokinase [Gayadomonas joobiniege]|uniref:glucokinase n=1 Tax=Gayadomonas joobiniege TaxID=1234606 RepID=UPI0003621689|nr:glucokinase [Gayadomonas joobiniege]
MTRLVADIGGTNMRIAQTTGINQLTDIRKYQVTDYASPAATIKAYIEETGCGKVTDACLAIASPIKGDVITMTNHSWQFSIEKSRCELGLSALHMINDFTAIALSVPFLQESQKVQIGGQAAVANKPIAVFGAGTGLGAAHVIPHAGKWIALAGEGGHVSFAPNSELERKVLAVLAEQFGHVSAERLISGQGIKNIYHALAKVLALPAEDLTPAEISAKAIAKECALCQQTLAMFAETMGSFGGNLAVNLLTEGGVYIAGGIVPRFIDYIKTSQFRQRFESKGRLASFNKNVPVFIVTEEQPGLLGAAAYLAQL